MPIYEYQCNHCHHQFDALQKLHDEPIKTCPECSKDTVIRLVSAAGFQLKGTGWYETDFKNKGKVEQKSDNKKTAASEKKSSDAPTPSTTTSKGDSN